MVPGKQVKQLVAPVTGKYVPAIQDVQLDAPTVLENVPTLQLVHAVAAQNMDTEPAGQAVQLALEFVPLYVPGEQALQATAPETFAEVPALH